MLKKLKDMVPSGAELNVMMAVNGPTMSGIILVVSVTIAQFMQELHRQRLIEFYTGNRIRKQFRKCHVEFF